MQSLDEHCNQLLFDYFHKHRLHVHIFSPCFNVSIDSTMHKNSASNKPNNRNNIKLQKLAALVHTIQFFHKLDDKK